MRAPLPFILGAAALAGCGPTDVTYSYFAITVDVDPRIEPEEVRPMIDTCPVVVETPRGEVGGDLHCVRNRIGDRYKFEFSTTLTSGSFKFTVLMKDRNLKVLARGESPQLGLVPGQTVPGSLTVSMAPGVGPDAGARAGAGDR